MQIAFVSVTTSPLGVDEIDVEVADLAEAVAAELERVRQQAEAVLADVERVLAVAARARDRRRG